MSHNIKKSERNILLNQGVFEDPSWEKPQLIEIKFEMDHFPTAPSFPCFL